MSLSRERGRRFNSGNDVFLEDKRPEEHTYGSTDFDHSTDKLKLHATTISGDLKKLHKYREKIKKKEKQLKSKHLEICKLTYKQTLDSLKEEINEIKDILDKRDRKPVRTQSQRLLKNESIPEECSGCKWKQSQIQTLKKQLSQQHIPNHDQDRTQQLIKERDDAVEKQNELLQTNNPVQRREELRQQKACQNREIESLRQQNQAEKDLKEDALKRLNEVSKTHIPLQHFDELKQQNAWLDREIENVRQQIQAEKAAKEDALRRLNDVSKTHVPVQSFNELKQQKVWLDREIGSVRQQNQANKAEKEDALRRLNDVSKTHVPVQSFNELKQQKAWLDREIESVRQQNQANKAEKEDALRRLNDVSKTHVPVQSFNELTQQKAWLDREIESVRQQNQAEQAEKEAALRRLKDVSKTHVPVQSFDELKQQKARLDREIEIVRQQNQDEKAEKEDALRRLNNVSRTHAPLQHFDELRKQKAWQDREIESLRQRNQAEKAAMEDALRRLNEVSKTHVPLQHFDELKQQKAWLDREIESVRQQIQAEKAAKEDALKRLSTMASSKLRDNNPNITDLSDQNRPTKISEKMSELYDNQWTDAFDALEKQKMQEREIIYTLLQSLMTAYHECYRLANEHFFETVQAAIECPRQVLQPSRYQVVMTDQLKQQIKEFRKNRAPKIIEEIEKIVKPRIPLASNRSQEINSYLSKCVEIGWLMVVQDPSLALVDKSTISFDTNKFKDYTKRGRYIEYVVWPALFLHEKGPLLGKGVAQGCDVKPDQTRSLGRALGKRQGGQNSRMLESCILQTSPKRPVVDERFFQAPVQESARSSTNV
ncbi:centrosomal protein of 128 kDa-like [Mercenaria mercenaria]|uniref:centrosomal protein of 128 kDa-like n=1 Tax=Mercenaria mercenaria TaxID=6596 RepID=UPI00234F613C|nr:centrosomal protein of 128 kDa-like [Mercenaria mercenaria]